jgi:hypothetical protein
VGSCWYVHRNHFRCRSGFACYSIQSAGMRTLYSLIGMPWALLGIKIQRFALSHRIQQQSKSESAAIERKLPTPRLAAMRTHDRDWICYWLHDWSCIRTSERFLGCCHKVVAIRPSPSITISLTCMMVFGTIIGALIAAVITLENSNPYLRLVLLFSFAVMLYATMRVNVILTLLPVPIKIDVAMVHVCLF